MCTHYERHCYENKDRAEKNPFWIGFAAGLVAGAIATGVMLLLIASFGGITLPEVVGSALILLMPPSWFDFLHQVVGAEAKHYLFYGIVIGQCLVFALIAYPNNLVQEEG